MRWRARFLIGAGIALAAAAPWWIARLPDSTGEYRAGTPTAPSVQPRSVTLLFVGDIMLDRGIDTQMRRRNDWAFPFRRMQSILAEADLTIGNLEGPISDRGSNVGSMYSFRADPRALEGIVAAGFDILSIANNHIWDYGPNAAADTIDRLTNAGITAIGGGVNARAAHEPHIRTINGMRIAFLAYTDLIPQSRDSTDASPAIAYLNLATMRADIAAAVSKADVIVIVLHWGNEYEPHPTVQQREIARELIATGATLVIGHHPHVIQDIEEIGEGLVAYSLGNFIFDQNFSSETAEALVLSVKLNKNGIADWQELPIRFTAAFEPYLASTTP